MNLIKRILLIVLAAAAFAQPAYSMDVAIVARFIEFIRPHAAKVGWYGVNQVWYFVVGNGPVIAVSSYIAYIGIRRFLSGELGALNRRVDEVGKKVDGVGKKVDDANRTLDTVKEKQVEHGIVLNALQVGQNQQGEQLNRLEKGVVTANSNLDDVNEKLEFLAKGHGKNQEALLNLLGSEEDIKKGLGILDKKVDDLAIILNNDRAKEEEQEKAFNELIINEEKLYKEVFKLQEDGKLQNDKIIFEITGIQDKIQKTQDTYITRMDRFEARVEAEVKTYKAESDKKFEDQKEQINKIHAEYAALRKELKDRDEAARKEKEETEIKHKEEMDNFQNVVLTAIKDGNKDLREDIKTDTQKSIAITVANISKKKYEELPSPEKPTNNPLLRTEVTEVNTELKPFPIFSRQTIGNSGTSALIQPITQRNFVISNSLLN